MQIQPVKPADEFNAHREQGGRPGDAGLAGASQESTRPLSGGVTSGQGASGGTTRDATEPHQTKDRTAAVESLLSRIATQARLPGHTKIAIEVDQTTYETSFLLVDKDSGEVVRRIPEQQMRDLLSESGSGSLVDQTL